MKAALRRSALAVLVACAGSCTREAKHVVEWASVVGPTVSNNALLGLTPEQVQTLFVHALADDGHFALTKEGERSPEGVAPVRLTLELAFTRTSSTQGKAPLAEVGAQISLRRKDADGWARYEAVGLGQAPVARDDDTSRRGALQTALTTALANAVANTHLQLAALDKNDDALKKDLSSSDLRVRELAVRTLAERGNPAVTNALIERLKSPEPEEVRRAIHGLVQIRDPRSAGPLIDLARGKDMAFLREIVYALGEIGGEEAEAYLDTVKDGHDQPEIRDAATQALLELRDRAARQRKAGSPAKEQR